MTHSAVSLYNCPHREQTTGGVLDSWFLSATQKGKTSLTASNGSWRKTRLVNDLSAMLLILLIIMTIKQFVIHNLMVFRTKLE